MFLHTKGRKDLRRKLNSIWDTLSLNSLGNIQVEWPNGLEKYIWETLRLTLVGRARGVNGVLGKAAEREGGIPRNQTYISGVD